MDHTGLGGSRLVKRPNLFCPRTYTDVLNRESLELANIHGNAHLSKRFVCLCVLYIASHSDIQHTILFCLSILFQYLHVLYFVFACYYFNRSLLFQFWTAKKSDLLVCSLFAVIFEIKNGWPVQTNPMRLEKVGKNKIQTSSTQ